MSKETNNLTVKIFALIIAIILWIGVMREENPTIESEIRNIPVEINNLTSLESDKLTIVEPKEPTINITVSGKRNVLNKLNKINNRDILATVDVKGSEEGIRKLPVSVQLPKDVKIVDISSKELSFKFEKIVSKEALIEIETTGELPKGYRIGEPKVVPQSLYIEGARSWIDSLDKALVTIDLTNKTSDISVKAPIKLLDTKGELIKEVEKDRSTVDVFIPIYQIKQVPIEIVKKNDDGETKIGLSPSQVEITGSKASLDKINSIRTNPIDIRTAYDGMLITLELPKDVHLVSKEEIKLILNPGGEPEKPKRKTFVYALDEMNILGLTEGLAVSNESKSISLELTIEGMDNVIAELKKEDLDIQLDLTGLEEGEHQVTPVIPAKPGITLSEIKPEEFKIKLIKKD